MYILFNKNSIVQEHIPDIDPTFPDVPIEERYAPDFISRMVHVADDADIAQGMVYDAETDTFAPPPPPSPEELERIKREQEREREILEAQNTPPGEPTPTQAEQLRADLDYIAAMMGVEL